MMNAKGCLDDFQKPCWRWNLHDVIPTYTEVSRRTVGGHGRQPSPGAGAGGSVARPAGRRLFSGGGGEDRRSDEEVDWASSDSTRFHVRDAVEEGREREKAAAEEEYGQQLERAERRRKSSSCRSVALRGSRLPAPESGAKARIPRVLLSWA
ncbi:hypothetical protein AXG93_4874s1080 [Marchantia polymorpha subsp. ruderalis]|uniref:Uncharacterized protein n=1 Tax=Marchantia polymorpha subsp. ruderalis TaxID=1480154 RepID=A0A176WHG7_MARPO|nr:hypothetical protein AXG93_4874s1080 [Marchantia polymorpha subsp. ruderalis]